MLLFLLETRYEYFNYDGCIYFFNLTSMFNFKFACDLEDTTQPTTMISFIPIKITLVRKVQILYTKL